jgi:PBP1b-binding outer membrane lipoprotein LpoB
MDKIKKFWKEIVIVLLLILFLSKCSSSGNYERKYNKQVAYNEFVVDSMNTVYSNSSKYIDSLQNVIKTKDIEIANLNQQLEIYKSQNDKLNDANNKLANKQVIVKVNKNE